MKKASLILKPAVVASLLAAILLTMGGCNTTVPNKTKSRSSTQGAAAPVMGEESSNQTQINQVLALNAAGRLSDEETTRLLREITGVASPTTKSAETQPVAVKPIISPTETAPSPTSERTAIASKTNADGLVIYKPEFNLNGRIRSIGSDTLDKLMALWESKFKEYHPSLHMSHEGKGSSTAIPALIEGRADIGPMSRSVKPSEVENFRAKYGYEPLQIKVALDALAIYVHPENPILKKGITLAQLDSIFSSTHLQGESQDITTWGQLGLTGEWAKAPIVVYSRNKASGTYGFFKDTVLKGGDYKVTNNEMVGSAEVVDAVANDKFAIGYSGIGYITPQVRTIPVAKDAMRPYIPASKETALAGNYPLARFLYITLNHSRSTSADVNVIEFIRFVLSAEGQALVENDGYYQLTQRLLDEEISKLN